MDVFTHGLTAGLLACALNLPQLVPFIVLGAVIADTDIFFGGIADRSPSLYLFTHGGFSHSIAGAVILSGIAWTAATFVLETGIVRSALPIPGATVTFAAVLAGALLHNALDTLAVPGLPLLAPFSDRKYTAGLLPGPSIFLMGASLSFLVLAGFGGVGLSAILLPYAGVFSAFLVVRCASFCIARRALDGKGRAIPRISPFRWLVISETPEAWTVSEYRIGQGMGEPVFFMKYRSTSAEETGPLLTLPEVRRLRFHSYIVTVEKVGDDILFSDPLRESGQIFYPPHYKRVRVPLPA